jgi:hypothetical protein
MSKGQDGERCVDEAELHVALGNLRNLRNFVPGKSAELETGDGRKMEQEEGSENYYEGNIWSNE